MIVLEMAFKCMDVCWAERWVRTGRRTILPIVHDSSRRVNNARQSGCSLQWIVADSYKHPIGQPCLGHLKPIARSGGFTGNWESPQNEAICQNGGRSGRSHEGKSQNEPTTWAPKPGNRANEPMGSAPKPRNRANEPIPSPDTASARLDNRCGRKNCCIRQILPGTLHRGCIPDGAGIVTARESCVIACDERGEVTSSFGRVGATHRRKAEAIGGMHPPCRTSPHPGPPGIGPHSNSLMNRFVNWTGSPWCWSPIGPRAGRPGSSTLSITV